MEWKVFRIKGKLVSTKHKMLKVFRLLGDVEKEDLNFSSPTLVSTVAPYKPVDSLMNRSSELELKKAEALEYWCRRLDRPK